MTQTNRFFKFCMASLNVSPPRYQMLLRIHHHHPFTFHSPFVLTCPTTPFLHPYAPCYPIFCGFRRNCTIHDSCSRPDLRRFRPLPYFFTSYIRTKTSPATSSRPILSRTDSSSCRFNSPRQYHILSMDVGWVDECYEC